MPTTYLCNQKALKYDQNSATSNQKQSECKQSTLACEQNQSGSKLTT